MSVTLPAAFFNVVILSSVDEDIEHADVSPVDPSLSLRDLLKILELIRIHLSNPSCETVVYIREILQHVHLSLVEGERTTSPVPDEREISAHFAHAFPTVCLVHGQPGMFGQSLWGATYRGDRSRIMIWIGIARALARMHSHENLSEAQFYHFTVVVILHEIAHHSVQHWFPNQFTPPTAGSLDILRGRDKGEAGDAMEYRLLGGRMSLTFPARPSQAYMDMKVASTPAMYSLSDKRYPIPENCSREFVMSLRTTRLRRITPSELQQVDLDPSAFVAARLDSSTRFEPSTSIEPMDDDPSYVSVPVGGHGLGFPDVLERGWKTSRDST